MNFIRLLERVRNEEDAVTFLQEHRILHNPHVCAQGHNMVLRIGARDRWMCSVQGCREFKEVRQDTFLTGSKLSFRKIVLFIYCWAKELMSVKFCEEELEINHSTVVDWANYLREVCAHSMMNHQDTIGGQGLTLEIDESMFSHRKNHVGRVLPKQWVFGGRCRETKECFLVSVPNRSAEILLSIIEQRIRPGSRIISDEWGAYRGIGNLPGRYVHETVNHRLHFVDPQTGAHTKSIESTWRLAKQKNKLKCGTSRELLGSYLVEFMWRQHYSNKDLFQQILTDIAAYWAPQ